MSSGGTFGGVPGPAFVASGTIGPNLWVKLSATERNVTQCSATTDAPFGISQMGQKGTPGVSGSDTTVAASAGDPLQVIGPGNVGLIIAGGTVAAGDRVNSDANAKAVTVPAGAGNYNVGGYALTGGSSGQLIEVYVLPHRDTH